MPDGVPGFGEGAPLDLSGLTVLERAGVARRLSDGSFRTWAETASRVRFCARPVRLRGHSTVIDKETGEILDQFDSRQAPLGVLHRPCGNRRAEVCPACSRTYARDTFVMIRAGIAGGKTVPETVSANPLLFVTFTAPSFGPVHGARPANGMPTGGRCRPRDWHEVCAHERPTGCMERHDPDDPVNGAPICDACYDWHSAVIWQWWAPELWRRTTIAIRRELARTLEVAEKDLRVVASLQYAKVAEFQHRGLIHFHALIRLDGPDGPGSPATLDGHELKRHIRSAVRHVGFSVPGVDADDRDRRLVWGRQLDIRVVRTGHRFDGVDGQLTAEQVAGYLAKYATKDAGSLRHSNSPRPHLARLAQACRELSTRAVMADLASPYRLLRKWSKMLGFRGHFSTKSRRYSVTLGQLRRARARYQRLVASSSRTGEELDLADLEARLLADETETTLVVGSWTYDGTGWDSPGDAALALAAASRAREYDQWRARTRRDARNLRPPDSRPASVLRVGRQGRSEAESEGHEVPLTGGPENGSSTVGWPRPPTHQSREC